jgi:hypothetical protein
MEKQIIKSMLNDSTWKSPEKKDFYKFVNGDVLLVNGKDQFSYSIDSQNNKIVLQLGSEKTYSIEYVDDFNLKIFNNIESFSITPD